ncbi:MAG: M20/M25/M40 family metallo-hydrolase [Clostridia bacterium]|nr:M20/M25/M40 family metallo-hydrolase [Clostridia bacterium]
MDIKAFLAEISALPGPSGHEGPVAQALAERFRPLCDEVWVDPMYNVIAHKKGAGPKVMLAAHQDEIALMVTRIEADGCLRLGQVGGVDPRILPGCQVWVWGKEKLFGVVGAKPPHLLTPEDQKKNYLRDDLYVDVGYPAEKVRELVKIGDIVTFNTPATALMNDRFACKTMDDRACVGILLETLERLQTLRCDADLYFVASSQEEVGSRGARAAAFDLQPDLAVALDVCHATIPGSRPDTTCDIDSLCASQGPFIQPKLFERLMNTAKAHGVKVQKDVAPARTYTDADNLQISREGVPTVLLSLPLKYMHTTVETIDLNALREGGRLIAHFLSELDSHWEDDLWI